MRWVPLTFLMLALSQTVFAGRGVVVDLRESEASGAPVAEQKQLYSKSFALVIGIDDYTGGWRDLDEAVKDAEAVTGVLEDRGFEVTLLKNVDSNTLRSELRRFFTVKGNDPDARLLLWYAGHGHTINDEGFLVPSDAPAANDPSFKISALHMRDFGGLVRLAESKHVLSIFDSCFSGTIFTSRAGSVPPAITARTAKPVRQFLTSGAAQQTVRDDGSFRKLFLRAIEGEDNRADSNSDGYVTGSELGLYMSQSVEDLTSGAQTPKSGKLQDVKYDQGDFVFLTKVGGQATMAQQTKAVSIERAKADENPSIAVLPFVNMSDDASNEYFSEGLSEEVLNLLTKIPELHVIARTSSFSFKGKNKSIPDIARELNATHLLEGSVRKSGNRVRITTQLIQAETGYHLWSETYDRTLDDIFVIQDEISASVAEQLKISLLGIVPTVQKTDPEAYAFLLQARYLSNEHTAESLERSITIYQQALAIDPSYAASWNELAEVYTALTGMGRMDFKKGYQMAREASNRSLSINPDYAPAYANLGFIALVHDGDLVEAARQIERAMQLEATNPDIRLVVARFTRNLGRMEEAIAIYKYIIDHDPMNAQSYINLSRAYFYTGRTDESIATDHIAISLGSNPNSTGTQFFYGQAALLKGEPEVALARMQQETNPIYRLIGLPLAYHALGQSAESDAATAELIKKYERAAAYNIAYVFAYRGEVDRAFAWLQKARVYNDPGLSDAHVDIMFANIKTDPRWLPFLEGIGKSPKQLAEIEFNVTLPGH